MTGGDRQPARSSTTSTRTNVNPINGLDPQRRRRPDRPRLCPAPTGNAAEDPIYEGWLYAVVATPGDGFYGLFVTKDFGQNWTKSASRHPRPAPATAIPTNDVTLPDYPIIGNGQFNRRAITSSSLAVDPDRPQHHLRGRQLVDWTEPSHNTALIRVDTTDIWDAHSLVAYPTSPTTAARSTMTPPAGRPSTPPSTHLRHRTRRD